MAQNHYWAWVCALFFDAVERFLSEAGTRPGRRPTFLLVQEGRPRTRPPLPAAPSLRYGAGAGTRGKHPFGPSLRSAWPALCRCAARLESTPQHPRHCCRRPSAFPLLSAPAAPGSGRGQRYRRTALHRPLTCARLFERSAKSSWGAPQTEAGGAGLPGAKRRNADGRARVLWLLSWGRHFGAGTKATRSPGRNPVRPARPLPLAAYAEVRQALP